MKHFYLSLTATLLLTTAALAQTFKPTSHWRAGSSGQDGIWDIAIDTAGNQYICGYFTGTVDIDPGPAVHNLTMPAVQTLPDAFLLKLDANGNFVWAKHFGGTTNSRRIARKVALDRFGNVYVSGIYYNGNIQFTSTSSLWTNNASGSSYAPFLTKFTSSGSFSWGYGWSNTSNAFIWDMVADYYGNIFCTGNFTGSFDFNPNPGAGNVNIKTSSGLEDMYLMKLSPSGAFKKIRTAGSAGRDALSGISILVNGDIFLSGYFSNTVDLDLSSGVDNRTSISGRDAFILKIDTLLNHKWVNVFGGIGEIYPKRILYKNGILINCGEFSQSIDFDPSTQSSSVLSSNGDYDFFIQRLDTNGNLIWAKSIGGTGDDSPLGMDIDSQTHIYLSGHFENAVDFDPSPNSSMILISNGNLDGCLVKLDSAGNFLVAAQFGSGASAVGFQEVLYSTKSPENALFSYAGGAFAGTIDINPSSLVTQNVTSAGQDDMLYLKLESCTNALVQSTATACGSSYQLPSGTVVTQSGYYLDTVLSTQGCDSTNGITVTLNPLPSTTVTQTGATFTAQPGLTYQWLNCQTNQPIAGETNQTFTATANGQYAVIVGNGNCTDTSNCYTLNNIGVQEAHLPVVNLYPNPTTGLLHIESPQPWQQVEVTDMLGRTVLTHAYRLAGQPEPKEALDLGKLPTGIYLVKVHFKEGIGVYRVVKR